MLIGYARVSTEDQLLDLQQEAPIKAGVEPGRIYEEHVSGAKTRRPQLAECLRSLRKRYAVADRRRQGRCALIH